MILGIGSDVVEIERVRNVMMRHGQSFVDRCFTLSEQKLADGKKDQAKFWAKQFAAKESVVKALGTGFRSPIRWHDIEVLRDQLGRPIVTLNSGALQVANTFCSVDNTSWRFHLTLSDEKNIAIAFSIFEQHGSIKSRASNKA
jgi:holo-[acyl-carrier protein] synthase